MENATDEPFMTPNGSFIGAVDAALVIFMVVFYFWPYVGHCVSGC